MLSALSLLLNFDTVFGQNILHIINREILFLENDSEFVDKLYEKAINENNENIKIQLMTWAADLGNELAINYIHTHGEIDGILAEKLDKSTYYFFKERENHTKNTYSLYMLALINHVVNNPEADSTRIESTLAIEYYKKSIIKKNPQAMVKLAEFYFAHMEMSHDGFEDELNLGDKSDEIVQLINEAIALNFPIPEYLQKLFKPNSVTYNL